MLTYMHMLLLVLAGSALSVVLKLKTNWELRSSSWVTEKLSSLTTLMDQNGSFAQPAKCAIISPVSPPIQSNRLNLKAGHLSAPIISAMPGHIKWVTHKETRSANRVTKLKLVTKRAILTELLLSRNMAKKKFSMKGKGGKVLRTPEDRKLASSHKGQKNQKWKVEQMEKAEALWKANDDLPPDKRLSMRAIARQVGIGKTTIIERLSGRRKGTGHIASGSRKG